MSSRGDSRLHSQGGIVWHKWITKFKGQFDKGWDHLREEIYARQKQMGIIPADAKLTPRPKEIPSWESMSADQQQLYARMMEVYAGALAHCDYQIGRVIDSIEEMGELDNTMVIFIQGDNGASAEGTLQGLANEIGVLANGVPESLDYLRSIMDELGGPIAYNHYPVAWAHALDTPFQWTKQVASHFGGTRNGLVISWPKRITDKGGIRSQFHHVIDLVPTILEVTGIQFPKMLNGVAQKPIEGVSMAYSFANAGAPSTRTTQYFEMLGNRAIYHDGWMAATTPLRLPWVFSGSKVSPEEFPWELYRVSEDFSAADNLATRNPDKLKELQGVFDREAKKYNVYPLDASLAERLDPAIRPSLTRGRTVFTYYPGMIRIPEATAPDMKNKSYSVTAEVEIPTGGDATGGDATGGDATGVLVTQGGRFGGWGLLVLDGKPMFVHAFSNQEQHKYRIASPQKLSPGKHTVRFDFQYDGGGTGKGGTGTLLVDGQQVAQGHIERTVRFRFSLDETLDIGEDTGTAVVDEYATRLPFKFSGALAKVTINLAPQTLSAADHKEIEESGKALKAAE